MKRFWLFIILIIFAIFCNKRNNFIDPFSAMYHKDDSSTNTITWTKDDSPIYIYNNFFIPSEKILKIDSGVYIRIYGTATEAANIFVEGSIQISGVSNAPVVFNSIDNGLSRIILRSISLNNIFSYVNLDQTSLVCFTSSLSMNNCKIKYIKICGTGSSFISPVLLKSVIGMVNLETYAAPIIKHSYFNRKFFSPSTIVDTINFEKQWNVFISDNALPVMLSNSFMGNEDILNNYIIATDITTNLRDFSWNYWGTNSISTITNFLFSPNINKRVNNIIQAAETNIYFFSH